MENKDIENITDPTDLGLEPLSIYADRICPPYKDVDLLNSRTYKADESVNLKGPYLRTIQIKDYIAVIEVKQKDFTVTPKLGGIVKKAYEKEKVFNNRTDEKTETEYELLLKRANSEKEKLVEINSERMYDIKEFKKATGCFCTFTEKEAINFMKQESEKTNLHITEYSNTGKIDFNKMDWLWKNAVIIDNKLYTEIHNYDRIKLDEHNYIKATKKARRQLPVYYPSNKDISTVLIELFNNIALAWNGAIEPFLAFGFMAMSPFYNYFWKHEGFGAVGFIGSTEGGKTEICNLAIGIFGCDKTFFSTARSTNVGIEQSLNSYNCIPRVIDDISRYNLTGDKFIDMLKHISNGGQRDKGKNGQESGALPPCSPLVFTSNNVPAEKPEILNRMLYLSADNLTFNSDVFKYFGCADKELSCILPHILKYTGNDIRTKHEHYKKWIKDTFDDSSDRMLSQLAIALTGLNIFEEISGCELSIPWDKLSSYVHDCASRFKRFKNHTEKLLEAFPTLIWNGQITKNNHYKVVKIDDKIILTFSKVAVCKAYNKYFIEDKSESIRSNDIKPVQSDLYDIIVFNKPVNICNNRAHGIQLDITKHPLAEAILEGRSNIF